MGAPKWLPRRAVLDLHAEEMGRRGGVPGLRDEGLLDSALGRPQNLHVYGEPDLADLAAAYGFGLARNHPFVDGNKRASFVATELFLALNGHALAADDAACVATWLALADGSLGEAGLAEWVRAKMRPA